MVASRAARPTPSETAAAQSRALPRTLTPAPSGSLHRPSTGAPPKDAAVEPEAWKARAGAGPAGATSTKARSSPAITHAHRSTGQPGAHSMREENPGSATTSAHDATPARQAAATSPAAAVSGQARTAPTAGPGWSSAGRPPASPAASASRTSTFASAPAATPPSTAGRSRAPRASEWMTSTTSGGQRPSASARRAPGASDLAARRPAAAARSSISGARAKLIASYHPRGRQLGDPSTRDAEQATVNSLVVPPEGGTGRKAQRGGAPEAQRAVRHDDRSQVGMVNGLEGPAFVEVAVAYHLLHPPHCRHRDPGPAKHGHDLVARQSRAPGGDERVEFLEVVIAAPVGAEALVVGQIRAAHGGAELAPLAFGHHDYGHMAVPGGIDVVRAHRPAPVAVAAAGGGSVAVPPGQVRGQGRVDGVDHGYVDYPARAGALTLVQGGENPGVEVGPTEEVDESHPRFDRCLVREPSHAHDPGVRLDGDVHSQLLPVGAVDPIARRRSVDQAGVDLEERFGTDPEAVHGARREVLDQHIGDLNQPVQKLASAGVLEVQGHPGFVGVQHRQRHGGAVDSSSPGWLTAGFFHLDHLGSGQSHQQSAPRPLVDTPEVENPDARQRQRLAHPEASGGDLIPHPRSVRIPISPHPRSAWWRAGRSAGPSGPSCRCGRSARCTSRSRPAAAGGAGTCASSRLAH